MTRASVVSISKTEGKINNRMLRRQQSTISAMMWTHALRSFALRSLWFLPSPASSARQFNQKHGIVKVRPLKRFASLFVTICMLGVTTRSSAAFQLRNRCSSFHRAGAVIRQMSLEVEQKFALTDSGGDLEARLSGLGFKPDGKKTFVDWYFDTEDVRLTTQDCWFRFREMGGDGEWQLKRGRGENSASTVYEETEGDVAVTNVLSLLEENTRDEPSTKSETFDGYAIPKIPGGENCGLLPFCRLETTRSSWSAGGDHEGMVVDLDTTNTGYGVGEVETVVEDESDIAKAKERVQSLISRITENTNSDDGPAIGKLEHYLIKNRPEHYQACIESGVIKTKY